MIDGIVEFSGRNTSLVHATLQKARASGVAQALLPAHAEPGAPAEQDRAKASTACPTSGLIPNSTRSGVRRLISEVVDFERQIKAAAT